MCICWSIAPQQLLGALAMGATGAVGSTYNYMGATYERLIRAFERGDWSAALVEQRRSQQGVDLLYDAAKYGDAVNVGKALLELKGVPVGPPRLPKLPMAADGKRRLRDDADRIGFFSWS
jgi:N-acetylneuraminate lyase